MTPKLHPTDSEVFKFKSHQTSSVKIENISPHATINEVIALFTTLVGSVKGTRAYDNSLGGYLEITFFNQDAATKALRISGYRIHGMALIVSAIMQPRTTALHKDQIDDRQNLYVLGLPFSLTKSEFSAIFSRHGTIVHCVILATLDNSSRRRGFVVMSTHEEARLAMTSLHRTEIKGHCIDISWAVVQRSHGFLDGGDRSMSLDIRTSIESRPCTMPQEPLEITRANSSASSIDSNEDELASLAPSLVPTPILLVTNLPGLLFSNPQDMQPLFCPFGRVRKLKTVEMLSNGNTAAIVEYNSAEIAQEAKETLHGQYYAGYQIVACYARTKSSFLDLASVFDAAYYKANAFPVFPRRSPPLLKPVDSCYGFSHPKYFKNSRYAPPPGLQDAYLRAPPLNVRQYNISRSSSTSSK